MNKFTHPVSAAACLEQWYAAHNKVVERVIKSRLRRFPSHIPDCIQSFWQKFLEQEYCERFNPSRCSQEGYVAFLATFAAVNCLHTMMAPVSVPVDEVDVPSPEPHQSTNDGAARYLLQLISTNRLKAPEALVFLCKAWIGSGPVQLLEEHWNSTLLQLCEHVDKHLEGTEEDLQTPRLVLRVLREQLALPVDRPLGEQTLREMLRDERPSAAEGADPKEDGKKILFNYLEQARRVCSDGESPAQESHQAFIHESIARLKAKMQDRFCFLVRTVRTMAHVEKLLAWGWEKLLNMQADSYGALSCARGSEWLVKRMAFLLPRFQMPEDLTKSLSGCQPEETILNRLCQLGTDSMRAVRAVEASYYRACAVQG